MNRYQLVKADKVDGEASETDIVKDAMRLEPFYVFPKNVVSKMVALTKSGQTPSKVLAGIQGTICNGAQANLKPSFKVTLTTTKSPSGAPLKEVSENKKNFIALGREYVKRWFFDDISDHDFKETYNSDYEDYKKNILDTDGERLSVKSFDTFIPGLPSPYKKDVSKFYASLKYLPTIPDLELPPEEWNPQKHLMVIVNPENNSAILAPKVSTMVKTSWAGTTGSETTIENAYLGFLSSVNPASVHNLATKSIYTQSPSEWSVSGVKLHALRQSYAEDLTMLRSLYGMVEQDGTEIEWDQMLASSTNVKEAPLPNGNIGFTVELDLSTFCRHGVPKSEILSQ